MTVDVSLIEMPADVAREELKKYRRALHRRADAEYEEIATGLEALAEGTPLLSLSQVFATVPRDAQARPRLAIARADRRRVKYERSRGRDHFDSGYDRARGPRPHRSVLEVAAALPATAYHASSGFALVPLVPPHARGNRDLSRHFVLWEVEKWADRSSDVGPDIDPFLLRRVSDDLFAVVAQWDLSPLEQAILANRRSR